MEKKLIDPKIVIVVVKVQAILPFCCRTKREKNLKPKIFYCAGICPLRDGRCCCCRPSPLSTPKH